MRLRYVHFPKCGPLRDVRLVFGQEPLLFGETITGTASRPGVINFIVGVNGTGKSSLFRLLYSTFRSLKSREMPADAVTLAWDAHPGTELVTAIFHRPETGDAEAFLHLQQAPVAEQTTQEEWSALIETIAVTVKGDKAALRGLDAVQSSLAPAVLPRRVVAYSSGSDALWNLIEEFGLLDLDPLPEQMSPDAERPRGWSVEREWEEERPGRIADLLTVYELKRAQKQAGTSGDGGVTWLSSEAATQLTAEMRPLMELRQKALKNHLSRSQRNADPCFCVTDFDLRLCALAYGVATTARATAARDAVSGELLKQLLTFEPTHLSIVYRDADDRVSRILHEQLIAVCLLAEEVVRQPQGWCRAVIPLGRILNLDLKTRAEQIVPLGIPNATVEAIFTRAAGAKTGAEALLRIFSDNKDLAATPAEFFDGLRVWRTSGLLQEATLCIRRASHDAAKPTETVVTYDQLSDGEQALWGRIGLLKLLEAQNETLLLLDEPETHFNDVWKRELIDLIDDMILKTSKSQVLVATHTSIALTDVFSSEIIRLENKNGEARAVDIAFPTFGSDPGRIMLHVFGAKDVIGSRAAEYLREQLRRQWKDADRDELERLVAEIGSGWPRAKLNEILQRLTPNPDAAPHP